MLIGYARVSTQDQNPQLQEDALKEAGCEKVFIEKASGIKAGRPKLTEAINYMRINEDTLVVWRLDRLGRSLKQLVESVNMLNERGFGFKSCK